MVDFNTAIELIRRNGGFKPNKRDDSYYRTYKTQGNRPQQARISNHGTHLWTWYVKKVPVKSGFIIWMVQLMLFGFVHNDLVQWIRCGINPLIQLW